MQLDVSADHLVVIRQILKEVVPGIRVVAFGSRVSGSSQRNSDLDLCIMSESPISFGTLGALKDAFSDSNIPFKVDVLDWSSLEPDFKQIVSEKCCDVQ